jgi:hypothetical protein
MTRPKLPVVARGTAELASLGAKFVPTVANRLVPSTLFVMFDASDCLLQLCARAFKPQMAAVLKAIASRLQLMKKVANLNLLFLCCRGCRARLSCTKL